MIRLFVLVTVVAVGCGRVSSEIDDAAPPDANGAITVQAAPARLMVRQGENAQVQVTVTRGVTAPAQTAIITIAGFPTGVTADPLAIAASATEGTLVLHADAQAPQGETIGGTIVATSGPASDDAPLELLVAGRPGTLDLSFDNDGMFGKAVAGNTVGRGLTLQPDGKIVATGASGQGQALTMRLLKNGALDDSFGQGGVVSTGVGQTSGGIHLVGLADGRIILGGWGGSFNDFDFTLFGYGPTGDLDINFGTAGGTVSSDPGPAYAEFHTVLATATQLIGVGTLFPLDGTASSALAFRYGLDGKPDGTFAINEAGGSAEAAALQDDGRLLIAGGKAQSFWITRYVGSARDTTWNGNGEVLTDMDTGFDTVAGLAVLPGGKILAVGIAKNANTNRVGLVRYNPNGSLDLTFGNAGKVLHPISMDTHAPNGLATDAQGRFIFVGATPGFLWQVLRILPTGEIDTTFGENGATIVQIPDQASNGNQAGPYGVAIDADGRIVISGQAGPNTSAVLAVARLWP